MDTTYTHYAVVGRYFANAEYTLSWIQNAQAVLAHAGGLLRYGTAKLTFRAMS